MDRGLGHGTRIPEDKLAEIFEEFRRLGKDQSGRDRGMGLGLAIVERVARMLDHRIGVRSVPGEGSVFSVTVPVGIAAEIRPPEPAPAAPQPAGRIPGAGDRQRAAF